MRGKGLFDLARCEVPTKWTTLRQVCQRFKRKKHLRSLPNFDAFSARMIPHGVQARQTGICSVAMVHWRKSPQEVWMSQGLI